MAQKRGGGELSPMLENVPGKPGKRLGAAGTIGKPGIQAPEVCQLDFLVSMALPNWF